MSVRRLAEDAVQPANFAFTRENAEWAKHKIEDYPEGREASAVIPLLMRAQEQEGWVTKSAIELIAEMLGMPLIRVLEVATFYTQFQLAPVGKRAHIQVCGTTPCMLRGAGEIMEVCKKRISPNQFEVTSDGNLSWEEVECQGACVNAPMIMIFKDSYEDLTPTQMEHIVDRFGAGKGREITPGPQIDRIFSAPEGNHTSLIEMPEKTPVRKLGSKSKSVKTPSPSPAAVKAAPKKAPAKIAGVIGEVASKKADVATDVTGKTDSAKRTKRAVKKIAKVASVGLVSGGVEKPESENKIASERIASKKAVAKSPDADRPAAMKKPAKPDDLKLISGVGPKIEGILNDLGVFKFEQISKWKKAEREWVDGYLRFKGRIDRDDWVKQAKALAKGGAEEYLRVFGKKPR